MGRIEKVESNLYPVPPGAFLMNKKYVFVNLSDAEKEAGEGKNHRIACIGVLRDADHPEDRRFYANTWYLNKRIRETKVQNGLADPPLFADSLEVGLHVWIRAAGEKSGLLQDLKDVFGEKAAYHLLDLAAFLISSRSADLQYYPSWAREHALFSGSADSDPDLFPREIRMGRKIGLFRRKWLSHHAGDGRMLLCWDSTMAKGKPEGVDLVQKEPVKDMNRADTDYVIRQQDGLPLTYLHPPGSSADSIFASELITFLNLIKKQSGETAEICLICDGGSLSFDSLSRMEAMELSYILKLRTNASIYQQLKDSVMKEIFQDQNKLETGENDLLYAITVPCWIFTTGPGCYAQLIWSENLCHSRKKDLDPIIRRERIKLERFISSSRDLYFHPEDLQWVPPYFTLETVPQERPEGEEETAETPAVRVVGFKYNEKALERMRKKSGMMLFLTSQEQSPRETLSSFQKRDCVQETLKVLRGHPMKDSGKAGLVWFIASILRSLLVTGTSSLNYSFPEMIGALEAIKADKDPENDSRRRRYGLTRIQSEILALWGIDEEAVDREISRINI